MDTIDDQLKAFIESEVGVVVATRNEDLLPDIVFGWAPRVLEGGREVELFLDRSRSDQAMANLRANRLVAATFMSAITARAVQLKGWCTDTAEATDADAGRLQRHRQAFMEAMRSRGLPAHVSRGFWRRDVLRVRFSVEEYFDQTPGPRAGRKL